MNTKTSIDADDERFRDEIGKAKSPTALLLALQNQAEKTERSMNLFMWDLGVLFAAFADASDIIKRNSWESQFGIKTTKSTTFSRLKRTLRALHARVFGKVDASAQLRHVVSPSNIALLRDNLGADHASCDYGIWLCSMFQKPWFSFPAITPMSKDLMAIMKALDDNDLFGDGRRQRRGSPV